MNVPLSEEVLLPCDVAFFEWLVAVWAQLYFWVKIYLVLPCCSLSFASLTGRQYNVRLQLSLKAKLATFLNRLVGYGHMVFFVLDVSNQKTRTANFVVYLLNTIGTFK